MDDAMHGKGSVHHKKQEVSLSQSSGTCLLYRMLHIDPPAQTGGPLASACVSSINTKPAYLRCP